VRSVSPIAATGSRHFWALAILMISSGCGSAGPAVERPVAQVAPAPIFDSGPAAAPAPPIATAAKILGCQDEDQGCVRVTPGGDSAVSAGAMVVGEGDWNNNVTGKIGVTLAREMIFPPYVWVANHSAHTVSRVSTKTGAEVGRYWGGRNPSRTAVDLDGNVWIGGRDDGRLTQILWDITKCPDRDGDGMLLTSSAKALGPVNSAENPLADECVAYSAIPTPAQASIRGIAAGPDRRVWFGFTGGGVQSIDPVTHELGPHYPAEGLPVHRRDERGTYRPVVDEEGQALKAPGGGIYGLVVDREGLLYASPMQKSRLTRFNVFTKRWDAIYEGTGCQNYGIAIDGRDRVWLGCTDGGVMVFDPASMQTERFALPPDSGTVDGAVFGVALGEGPRNTSLGVTGLAVEPATGNVWASFWSQGWTGRLALDENEPGESTWTLIDTTREGRDLRGVGFDHEGFAWTHGAGSDRVWKIDPRTNRHVPGFEEGIPIGGGPHYTYSDFTGSTGLSFTSPHGVWNFTVEVPSPGGPLEQLRWEAFVPEGARAEIRLRPLDDDSPSSAGQWVPSPTEGGRAQFFPYESATMQALVDLEGHSLEAARYEIEVRMSTTGRERPVVNAVELVSRSSDTGP